MAGSKRPLGRVELIVKHGTREFLDYFLVLDSPVPLLMGNRARSALGLSISGLLMPVDRVVGAADPTEEESIEDHATLFDTSSPPIAGVPHSVRILLDENAKQSTFVACSHPMAVVEVAIPAGTKPYYEYDRRHAEFKHKAITSQVDEWVKVGIIERCPHGSPWNMGLVVVKKATPEGKPQKFRICIDPRAINKVTPDDLHPLPQILDYLDDACGAKVFSSLYLKGSFHQFSVRKEHRKFLAFTWKGVQYQFMRGPFGLKALAGQFQRVMTAILGDLPYVRVYIDDIIVFSDDVEEHEAHLCEVLRRLNLNHLCI